MTPENKRDEAIVLGALPGTMAGFARAVLRTRSHELLVYAAAYADAFRAAQRLKNAGKIRYNRSAKVWERTECSG